MSVRELVKALRKEGHKVTYRKRKDGGILIKSIDGQKFKGAKGNLLARQMLGINLSEKRALQSRYATVKKKWKW